jgi:transaldolase/glucose-6-phosphate isomerase
MTVIRGSFHLGAYEELIDKAVAKLGADDVLNRILRKDYTVWKPHPEEITNRLGWLHCPTETGRQLEGIRTFAEEIRREGFTRILLLGMGGSSLASDMFQRIFGASKGFPSLSILDSTDPDVIRDCEARLNGEQVLFIVSTKSGTTVETMSLFNYFFRQTAKRLGHDRAGKHFIAITDPGSVVVDIARRYGFREIFLNDPDIGGRYSALSLVGMVPAALVGIDVQTVLKRADETIQAEMTAKEGFSASRMGIALSELAKKGRNKATFILSPELAGFGDWLEQLIAESTGKENLGILPVTGEPLADPHYYGDDRLFIAIRRRGDQTCEQELTALAMPHPLARITVDDPLDLGGHCFFWQLATAVAGHGLGINPFDQPDVESSKARAKMMLAEYGEKGSLPEGKPFLTSDNMSFYGEISAGTAVDALEQFLRQSRPGDYVGLQVFLPPSPSIDETLSLIRRRIRNRFLLATSCGYGPRYLHSTGQLHKGDRGQGLFILFTTDSSCDIPIPDAADSPTSSISFGILRKAQALGDLQALQHAGRRILRIHLQGDIKASLASLARSL